MHLDWQLNLHQQHPFWSEPPRKRRLNMCRSLARMCSVPPQSTSALNSTRQRLRTAMLGCWARWSQIGFRRPPLSGSRARVDCRGPCRPVGQKTIGQERQCPRMCIATSLPQTLCHCFPMPRAPAMLFDGDCCQNFLTEIAKWLLKGLNHLLKNSWSMWWCDENSWWFWNLNSDIFGATVCATVAKKNEGRWATIRENSFQIPVRDALPPAICTWRVLPYPQSLLVIILPQCHLGSWICTRGMTWIFWWGRPNGLVMEEGGMPKGTQPSQPRCCGGLAVI